MQSATRTQADRSSQTRARLIQATIECLIEHGYAHATTVEICARAGLTRGAYNHHYASAADLFADVVEHLYEGFAPAGPDASLEEMIRAGWSRIQRPEFKAVIEIWLASRNDPELGKTLAPVVGRLSQLFEPTTNPDLAKRLGSHPDPMALYRLAFEASIGLALGRATSPGGAAVAHEGEVIDLLLELARERERSATSNSR